MEAFAQDGDFDFNIFTQTPGPTIPPKPKAEPKKRKEREHFDESNAEWEEAPLKKPSYWDEVRNHTQPQNKTGRFGNASSNNNNITEKKKEHDRYNDNKERQYNQKEENNKKEIKNHDNKEKENKKVDNKEKKKVEKPNKKEEADQPDEDKGKFEVTNTNFMAKNKVYDPENEPKVRDFDVDYDKKRKQGWVPSEADMANTITIERNGDTSMFQGQFSDTGLSDRLISFLENNMKMQQPTLIQKYAIPQILDGHDALIKAETGSGKTYTYTLPVLNVLGETKPAINRKDGTYAIILAPTRELVTQIYEVLIEASKTWIWVVPGYLTGGENKDTEKNRLKKGVSVLVATPGRLIDHLKTTASFKYDKLRFLVLDEADRLLDMGLGPQVAEIVGLLRMGCGDKTVTLTNQKQKKEYGRPAGTHMNKSQPTAPTPTSTSTSTPAEEPKKMNKTTKFEYDDGYVPKKTVVLEGKLFQTIMASATLHSGIRQLAYLALHKPVYVGLKPLAVADVLKSLKSKRTDIEEGQDYTTPDKLTQFYTVPKAKDRISTLCAFLQECAKKEKKVVVFTSSCDEVNYFQKIFTCANSNEKALPSKKRPSDKKTTKVERKAAKLEQRKNHKRKSETEPELEPESESESESEDEEMEEGEKRDFDANGIEFVPIINAKIYILHGDLAQVDRANNTSKFRKDPKGILITTDVSARGLDFPDIDWIIQFDPPTDTKDYIHRVGRTARMGRKGKSLLFLTQEEGEYLNYLKSLGLSLKEKKLSGDLHIHNLLNLYVRDDIEAMELAKSAYISSIRAYATHTQATKHIFRVSNLHVGHMAKSFCLRDKPHLLAKSVTQKQISQQKFEKAKKNENRTKRQFKSMPKRTATLEFDAGM